MENLDYGKWIKCDEGTMPEDVVRVVDYGKDNPRPGDVLITETVLIPFTWSDDYGHAGAFYPAHRWKLRRHREWHWNEAGMRPLYWLPIPSLAGKDYDKEWVDRVVRKYELERFEEKDMYTYVFKGVTRGDWVKCNNCGRRMLVPVGADKCPMCEEEGTLSWVDEERQEMDVHEIGTLRRAFWIEMKDNQ